VKRCVRKLLFVIAVAAAVVAVPSAALAHPLGNFTVNLYSGIQLTPGEVRIDYVLDMAEIPTFQEMPSIDANGDGTASDAERAGWAERTAPELLSNLTLTVGGRRVDLRVVSSDMRFRPGQGGLQILRLEATFAGEVASQGSLAYRDDNYADRIGWREITAVGAEGEAIAGSSVPAGSVSDGLLSYPQDLLASPLHVTRAALSFHPGTSAPAATSSEQLSGADARPGVTGGSFAGLVDQTGPFMLVAFLLAMAFGALHALGPGHGKTLMAAYLVGAGGRPKQAVAVGGAVAVMHTASVLALGFLVLSATRLFPPERVYPWLGLGSGLVALGLGAGLLVTRFGVWSNGRRAALAHDVDHDQDHAGERGHVHGDEHMHGGHGHTHTVPDAPVLSRRGLMALAVAGGILPSPTALVVLLGSVAFHRVAYGLGLIAAFSVGLATALIVVGILALRARDLVSRRMSGTVGRLVPVFSASAIVVLGLALTVRGFVQL
jgi:nickel/cobalt exporter